MLSAAEPIRVTFGAAVRLVVELKALSPAWAAVKAAVRLVVEVSADAACRTLSGAATADELAVMLAVTLMTTKRPTAVELKAKSMLPLTFVNTWAAAVMLPEAVRLAAPRNDAVDAYRAEPWVVSAALAGCTRVPTAAMLLLAVRADAPTWVSPTKFSVTRLSPLSVMRISPLSVMRGPSSNATPPSSPRGDDARGLKPSIYLFSEQSSQCQSL